MVLRERHLGIYFFPYFFLMVVALGEADSQNVCHHLLYLSKKHLKNINNI